METPGRLKGKVAIVTGAAHGLGAGLSVSLAREGARVACVDVCHDLPPCSYHMGTEEELAQVVKKIGDLGSSAIPIQCDVSKAAQVEAMVKRVKDDFGRIDILINNAAVVTLAPVADLPEEEWDLVIGVNLKGPFLCCKYVVPHMMGERAGKIVNIGSIDGREGVPGFAHYSPSKAGVHMLTDTLAKELAAYNINVNCVAPGAVSTPMLLSFLRRFTPESGLEQAYGASCQQLHLLGREVTVEDVASAVLFLVSEESRNITGYTFYVDGGHRGAGL